MYVCTLDEGELDSEFYEILYLSIHKRVREDHGPGDCI